MARPTTREKSALIKITESFWQLLEEKDYDKITVKLICQNAGINHNSFYYYYNNVDELAKHLIDNFPVMNSPTVNIIINGRLSELVDQEKDIELYRFWRNLALYTCRNSAYLEKLFFNHIKNIYLSNLNVSYDEFSEPDKYVLLYLLAGLTNLISIIRKKDDPLIIIQLLDTTIAKNMIEFSDNVKVKYHKLK